MRPRIRTVKPEMRYDEKYARLSLGARELFNGLITMADDEGRFQASTSLVVGHVFPHDKDALEEIRGRISEVKSSGMVLFYISGGFPYGAFRHWRRHQKVNRPTASVLPPPPDPNVVRENSVEPHDSFTEGSVNDHGSCVSPRAGARSGPSVGDVDVVLRLSFRLANHMRRNDPKAKPAPESSRWLNDMRLLLKDRDGEVEEVEQVIDWCQSDEFWKSVILSPSSLRKKFTALAIKAKAPVSLNGRRRHDPARRAKDEKLLMEKRKRLEEQLAREEMEAS